MWSRPNNAHNVSFGLRKMRVAIIWPADVDISSVINVVASTTAVIAKIFVALIDLICEQY